MSLGKDALREQACNIGIVCKYCGEKNLSWKRYKNGYRLYNGETEEFHNCSVIGPDEYAQYNDVMGNDNLWK